MTTYYTERHPVRAHDRRLPSGRVVPVRAHWRDNPTPNPHAVTRDYAWETCVRLEVFPEMYEEDWHEIERSYLQLHGIRYADLVCRPELVWAA